MNALNRVTKGEDFAEVAKIMSDDEMTASKGGVVPGRITSGVVQREIENAVFSTKVGEVYPELIETKYGYIVLKLLAMEPRKLVYSSHILFSYNIGEDSSDVKRRADSVLYLLRNGADFAQMAKEISDDQTTASKGGSFDSPYSRSTGLEPSGKDFLPEYEEALFNLNDGEISDVINTDYGMHIIKRDSTIDFNRDSELRNLEATYKRIYYNIDKNTLLDSLTQMYGMKVDMNVLQEVVNYLDTLYVEDGKFGKNVPENLFNKKLYTFLETDYTVEDYLDQMNSEKAVYGFGIDTTGLRKSINVMNRNAVLEKATANLENEYPEFKELMDEFKNGILLFKAEAEKVWNNLIFDTTLARQYYDTLSTEFLTKQEYDISEIFVKSQEEAQTIWEDIQNGADFDEMATNKTMRQGYREKQGNWGRLAAGKHLFADKAEQKNVHQGDVLPPFKYQNGWSVIKINTVFPPRKKTFEEAIPDIAPAVQDIKQKILTEKWLNEIKSDTDVVIHDKKINEVIKKLKK
jgi:peptidyl-prolyl cis-trans isomerase SurA